MENGGKKFYSRQELHQLLPAWTASAVLEQPRVLMLVKPGDWQLWRQTATPLALDNLLGELKVFLLTQLPQAGLIGTWQWDTFALLLPDCTAAQADGLGKRLDHLWRRTFAAQWHQPGLRSFLLWAWSAVPDSGLTTLGLQAEKNLQKAEGFFFPQPQSEAGEEAMGDFLSALLQMNDAYLSRQAALAAATLEELGAKLGFASESRRRLGLALALQDVGMLPSLGEGLWRPGPLTQREVASLRFHPTMAATLGRQLAWEEEVCQAMFCHHEHWDGRGYPRGLAREEIPPAAQLLAIASVHAALLLTRPYRPAYAPREAKRELLRLFGSDFRPDWRWAVEEATLEANLLWA